jgi:phospholipid transport system substrate-binding protein
MLRTVPIPTLALALGLAPAVLAPAAALPASASAQQSPVDVIRTQNQTVQRILRAHPTDEVTGADRERLKDELNALMDFTELSRRALGRSWDARTEAQRADFVNTFRELVRSSSVRKLGVHRADSISYRPAQVTGNQAVVTTVAWKDRRSAEIVYHMHQVGGQWRAWDVVVDGSSTMRTYRDSFTREINATSFEAMLVRLKERLEQEKGD